MDSVYEAKAGGVVPLCPPCSAPLPCYVGGGGGMVAGMGRGNCAGERYLGIAVVPARCAGPAGNHLDAALQQGASKAGRYNRSFAGLAKMESEVTSLWSKQIETSKDIG